MFNNVVAINTDPVSQLAQLVATLSQQVNQLSKEVKELKTGKIETKKTEYQEIDFIKTSDLNLDPARFQYKILHDSKSGASGSLTDVITFNIDLCGMLSVWRDPSNNRIYVINGHNRKHLADRTNQPFLPCRFINAKTAKEARIIGALQNISENSGSILDASKFFRESGKSLEDLKKLGLTLKGKVSESALKVSKLEGFLWEKYLLGELSEDRAIILGNYSPHQQTQIYSIAKNFTSLSLEKFEELAKMATANACNYQLDLFGNMTIDQDLIKKKLTLINAVSGELRKEARLFGSVAKNAQSLVKGNNRIDSLTSSSLSEIAAKAYQLLEEFKYVSSPVSDLINQALDLNAKQANKWLYDKLIELASGEFLGAFTKPKTNQEIILESISGEICLDVIHEKTKIQTGLILSELLILEMDGKIKQLPGGRYQRLG